MSSIGGISETIRSLNLKVLRLLTISSSSTPPSGKVFLYAKTDNKAYYKDSDGNERELKTAPRTGTVADSATPTPNSDTQDIFTITALAQSTTFGSPTGTPINGQKLIIRIKDNGTARALAWNAIYRASSDLALPTTTVLSKTLYMGFIYNSTDSKWDFVALLNNI